MKSEPRGPFALSLSKGFPSISEASTLRQAQDRPGSARTENCYFHWAGSITALDSNSTQGNHEKLPRDAVLFFAALSVSTVAQAGQAISPEELRFVEHATRCAQFLGGDQFGDSVPADYAHALSAALSASGNDIQTALIRLRAACVGKQAAKVANKVFAERSDQ